MELIAPIELAHDVFCHNRLSAFGVIGTEQDNKNNGGMKMGHNRLSAFGVIGTQIVGFGDTLEHAMSQSPFGFWGDWNQWN